MVSQQRRLPLISPSVAVMAYAHTKFAQQIQFTVGHLADFDSAYFSESESVKLVYITDIARFTRLETRLNSSAICRQHRCRGRCRLESTAYCLPNPDTSFTAVTHRFRDTLSFGKVYPLIWLRQSGTARLPDIFISSQKRLV